MISNHPVSGSVVVKAFNMRGLSLPYILILYGPIRYTNNLSHGIYFDSLGGNFTNLRNIF